LYLKTQVDDPEDTTLASGSSYGKNNPADITLSPGSSYGKSLDVTLASGTSYGANANASPEFGFDVQEPYEEVDGRHWPLPGKMVTAAKAPAAAPSAPPVHMYDAPPPMKNAVEPSLPLPPPPTKNTVQPSVPLPPPPRNFGEPSLPPPPSSRPRIATSSGAVMQQPLRAPQGPQSEKWPPPPPPERVRTTSMPANVERPMPSVPSAGAPVAPKDIIRASDQYEEPQSLQAWWFRRGEGVTKEKAESILKNSMVDGDFLVRRGQQDYFVLSRCFNQRILHARIIQVSGGFRFDGPKCMVYPTLPSLIETFQRTPLADGCLLQSSPPKHFIERSRDSVAFC
jgi:hypothetical protein